VSFAAPEAFSIADYFLDDRVREGRGDRTALVCGERRLTYREVQTLANRFAHVFTSLGVEPEQRVLIALPDSPEYVGALFGAFKVGAVAVMANPALKAPEIGYFLDYTRSRLAVVHADEVEPWAVAARGGRWLKRLLVVGGDPAGHASWEAEASGAPDHFDNVPTHRDDPCLWLFSGGTTGRPKAVVQTHRSYANTTELYAKATLRYSESDVTLSVPKLYFGYATGSNLFFPFAVGGTSVLFREHPTPEVVFEQIRRHRPTILINVPTLVSQMLAHPEAAHEDLSCLRFATSAGEALPPELYRRWKQTFGVELLDGLGTAEMWHIFITNRPGDVRPGTLGRAVEGFDVQVCDDSGRELPPGEVGALRVRGGSRALGYWQQAERTAAAFQGDWYVTGDLVSRDADGYFTYAGRADDMLKVAGKWVAPAEVEDCLLGHASVKECAVVGVTDAHGLSKPCAFVVLQDAGAGSPPLAAELQAFVKERLAPYKYPREVVFVEALPRTHLGKVDRGRLRQTRA
jgi:benzoate-CoA ligase family protein